jgi:16S rRNA (guanine1207-N2)-methyltransferase
VLADPVDRLILDVAREQLAGRPFGRCVVLDDRSGGLTQACLDEPTRADVRLCCDSLLDEQDVAAAVPGVTPSALDDPATLVGADLVLLRLPRSVEGVRALAERVAAVAAPEVVLVGGARVKHMTTAMNAALGQAFGEVTASLGRARSRALVARDPREIPAVAPDRQRYDPRLGFAIHAEAGVFAGTRLDRGTELLAASVERLTGELGDEPQQIVDLGCGSGVLATLLARRYAGAAVTAVDVSAAACRSTRATADGAGVGDRVVVRRSDGLAGVAPGRLDLVVANPPFHRDGAKDSGLAIEMITGAGRALRPGGELWLVWNSHLPYRPWLRAEVGPTEVVAQNRAYTLTRSVAARA